MPEPAESSSEPTSMWSFVFALILLYMLGLALDRVPRAIEARTGIDIYHPVASVQNFGELSATTRLGTRVITTSGADVFSNFIGGTLVGFQPADILGSLRGGPEEVGGARWWDVDFATGPDGWVPERVLKSKGVTSKIASFISWGTMFAFIFSFIALTLLLYFTYRTNQIRVKEKRKIEAQLPQEAVPLRNARWDQIAVHASSDNPNDWRLAIIEADIVLDEIVTRMGYRGASLGEKLKQADPSDFLTLNAAWEAHKTRNRIAHSGSDFILTQREAKRVIDLYEEVFREFHYL